VEEVEETIFMDPLQSLYIDHVTITFLHPPRNFQVMCNFLNVEQFVRNDAFVHRIFFGGRKCASIQLKMTKFHPIFGKMENGGKL